MQERRETCLLCGGSSLRTVARPKSLYSDEKHAVDHCADCDLLFVNPGLGAVDLVQSYVSDPGGLEYFRQLEGTKSGEQRGQLAAIRKRLPPPATLLEVGAGLGEFVDLASRAGYAARGLELSPDVVAEARTKGRAIAEQRLEDVDEIFDIVMSSHTIEHVPDPVDFVREQHRRLRPGGLLYVDFPYVEAHEHAKILESGEYEHWDPSAHVTYFTVPVMKRMLVENGFSDVHAHFEVGSLALDRDFVVRGIDAVLARVFSRERRVVRPWGVTAVKAAD